jgi:hypothetical protein
MSRVMERRIDRQGADSGRLTLRHAIGGPIALEIDMSVVRRRGARSLSVTHAFNFPGRDALGLLQAGDGEP